MWADIALKSLEVLLVVVLTSILGTILYICWTNRKVFINVQSKQYCKSFKEQLTEPLQLDFKQLFSE